MSEPAARAAYVWVLGEYGQRIQVGGGRARARAAPLCCAGPVQRRGAASALPGSAKMAQGPAAEAPLDAPPARCFHPLPPLQDAPYVMEGLVEGWADEEPAVKLVGGWV